MDVAIRQHLQDGQALGLVGRQSARDDELARRRAPGLQPGNLKPQAL
jgi:hypothetical protein